MEKRLTVIGNSLALVIDKPIRDVLGIGRNTLLRVSTDGRRIVIEPTGKLFVPTITATEIDAPRVFDTLVRAHNMWQPQFDELCPRKTRIMAYRGALGLDHPDDDTRLTMKRLEMCLQQLAGGAPWDQAIRVALETVQALATA